MWIYNYFLFPCQFYAAILISGLVISFDRVDQSQFLPELLRNVRDLFDSILFPITQLDLEHRSRCSWFFGRHIDFRLNQLSHMLGRSAIESGVLENIKVDGLYNINYYGTFYFAFSYRPTTSD